MKFRESLFLMWLPFAFFVMMAVGCKPSVSGKYLSPSKLEAILYDYHVADAMSSVENDYSDTLRMRVYKLAVLRKHGVTEADFDSSMVYYTRHADRLRTIYEHLSKRLSDEALTLGASSSEVNQYITLSETGDTASIWVGDRSFILAQQPGFSVYSFSLEVDSTYKSGDRFILSFGTKFIFQEGNRNGAAMLAIKFANDSVSSQMVRITSDNQYRIDISDSQRLGIKKVSGYFVLSRNNNDDITMLKLLHVGDIKLVRIHIPENKDNELTIIEDKLQNEKDSILPDSLEKPELHSHAIDLERQ